MMGVLKSVEPTGFLAFAPAFAGTNWADVNRRIIQNCPMSFVFARLFGSGFAGLGRNRPLNLVIRQIMRHAVARSKCHRSRLPPLCSRHHHVERNG